MMGFALVSHVSQVASGSLVTAIWEGILLAAVTGLVLRLLPKTPGAVRFAIWFAVFAAVAGLPVVTLWPHAAVSGRHGAWIELNERWCIGIAAVWLIASMVRAATLVAAGLRVRALWKRARPVELDVVANPTHDDQAVVNGVLSAVIGLTRRAQVCVSDEVDRPTVIGFFAPKILIPSWLLEKLTPTELEHILLHEAGHLGRADDWMNLLQKIALVIFPLNPALAWVERRLCFERELAVDERVLRAFEGQAGAAKAYAACLATLAEYRLGRRALALALGALGSESELGRRVGRILRRGETMRPLHAKLVLGGAMLGLLVSAAGLERCPQIVGFKAGDVAGARHQVAGLTDTAVRVVSDVYKQRPINSFRVTPHVAHATLAVALESRPSTVLTGMENDQKHDAVSHATSNPVRMVRTVAAVTPPRSKAQTISDTAPAPARTYAVELVVVTAWQGGKATRVAMTTTEVPVADPRLAAASQAPVPVEDGTSQSEGPMAVPYAAVPVRGGWLFFQL